MTGQKIAEAIVERLSVSRVESVTLEEASKIWHLTLAWLFSITTVHLRACGVGVGVRGSKGRSILKDIVGGGRVQSQAETKIDQFRVVGWLGLEEATKGTNVFKERVGQAALWRVVSL